jgi:hypothetical protein
MRAAGRISKAAQIAPFESSSLSAGPLGHVIMPTVFYAWQGDTPESVNHYFIRDALQDAVLALNANLSIDEALDVDSDAQGNPGSAPVAETILKKIDACMIIVSDVTFVATIPATEPDRKEKRFPNANVLIELGYARARHGHVGLVQVMNTHFGGPDLLPFDLGHLSRPIQFALTPNGTPEEKKRIRRELAGRLRRAIKTFLDDRARSPPTLPSSVPADEALFAGGEESRNILLQGDDRFKKRVAESSVALPPHGTFQVGVRIFGYPAPFHADREFLDLITRANPNYRKWPLWMNPLALTDASVRPRVRNDLWETTLILLDAKKWNAPSTDYWFASPVGRFYHRRGLWEDGLWPVTGHRPFQPGTALDLAQQVAHVAEAFVVGQSFAKAMSVPGNAEHMDFAFKWTGLKSRLLTSTTQPRLFLEDVHAEDDEALITCYLPVQADRAEILAKVVTVVRALANKFDAYAPNERIVKQSADGFLDRQVLQL